jgi:TPR repeat protein
MICTGCYHEHYLQSLAAAVSPVLFVEPTHLLQKNASKYEKRVGSNDVNAICQLGIVYLNGDRVSNTTKDVVKAVKLFHRAAELGSASAYCNLGVLYDEGDGVSKDKIRARQYFEKGANVHFRDFV